MGGFVSSITRYHQRFCHLGATVVARTAAQFAWAEAVVVIEDLRNSGFIDIFRLPERAGGPASQVFGFRVGLAYIITFFGSLGSVRIFG